MKIFDLLFPETVVEELKAETKDEVIKELAGVVAGNCEEIAPVELANILLERESLGSTGIGEGVAIPHGKYPGIKFLTGALGRSTKGVDFQSMDGKPAHLFFLLVAPENSAGLHLKALARISRLLKTDRFRKKIMDAGSQIEMVEILREEDERL
ncbi:MAG: PTS transporter subunit EIIA [Deltaproteobacteria bacterium]|nr:PTS transporter subunit EIIA [Deltaproteobacteria bacterium]NIS78567.1 PTS transporter subunit EIIA [Deltaproteobacteria bacterium]